MQEIIDQFNGGDKEAAISAAVHYIDEHPREVDAYRMLAAMLINMKAFDQADELIVKALGLFRDDPELRYNWGLSAYQQGSFKDALARLLPLTGKEITPSLRADAAYMVALSYQELGDDVRAVAFAMTAHDLFPEAIDAAVLTANLLLGQGVNEPVKPILAPLLKTGNAQVLLAYGMAVSATGEDGSQYLDEAKKADPDSYQRARELVHFLSEQEQHDEQ
ncbi:tetratricopeptide repeat protein [Lacticaseibacillus hulanensis]|uniref:tetratricopeptide repeat protein n=1 Tax=Lacticaseibacillus hulanensis TaxID=2493111 RepID=UPI000FD71C79|nr:tetratricopeptide repeat protein [Lacticaseibacillus hulanensis]